MKAPVQSQALVRLLGLVLFVVVIARFNPRQIAVIVGAADVRLVLLAVAAVIPLILVKSVRWRAILRGLAVEFSAGRAFSAYLSGVFVSSFTLAPMGEALKVVAVTAGGRVSSAKAASSVLADRLFDLYVLLVVGGVAMLRLAGGGGQAQVAILALLLTVPLIIFLYGPAFGALRRIGVALGRMGRWLFQPDSWLEQLRAGLLQLNAGRIAMAMGLTVAAYAVFFMQTYLLARALQLPAGFGTVSLAAALGSLAAALPLSVAGLGTREAAVTAYLSTLGIPGEMAVGFSLLIFMVFNLAGGLMGAVALWLKPITLPWRL